MRTAIYQSKRVSKAIETKSLTILECQLPVCNCDGTFIRVLLHACEEIAVIKCQVLDEQ